VWTGFIWLRIRKKWAAPVNTAINIRASENVKNFLTGFTRRTVFYRVGYFITEQLEVLGLHYVHFHKSFDLFAITVQYCV